MDYRNSENWENLWDNVESGDLLTESKKIEKKTEKLTESAKCPRPRKQRIVEEAENKDCKDGKCDKGEELSDAEKKRFSKAVKVAKPEKNLDECGDNLKEKKCCGKDCKDTKRENNLEESFEEWKVVDTAGNEILKGDEIVDFRGDKAIFDSITKAPTAPSEGLIYVKEGKLAREYYPSVFGLMIIEREIKESCGKDCKDDLNECGDNFEKELSEAFMAGYKAALKEGKTK